ncbi:hypothetical protein ZIOFF_030997 [Zingiber officinale]|uniref:Uncharacterized protein n=1 Tax=Zingiber officinale TaxID=94328 RepID=A0A8J5LIC6_ZINOF|nr:hypothetical protein ZIOFF_030997 [Zingiber officinale]
MVHAPMREDQLRQRTSFCGAGACKLRWIAAAPKAQKRGRSHALSRPSTAAPAENMRRLQLSYEFPCLDRSCICRPTLCDSIQLICWLIEFGCRLREWVDTERIAASSIAGARG